MAEDKQRLRIASEEDLFAVLSMPYLPPSERTEMRYKVLTNKRNYVWPEYAPYFAQQAQQLDLIQQSKTSHFFEAGDVDEKEKDKEARITAEREYNERLKTNPRPDWMLPNYNLWSGDFTHSKKGT